MSDLLKLPVKLIVLAELNSRIETDLRSLPTGIDDRSNFLKRLVREYAGKFTARKLAAGIMAAMESTDGRVSEGARDLLEELISVVNTAFYLPGHVSEDTAIATIVLLQNSLASKENDHQMIEAAAEAVGESTERPISGSCTERSAPTIRGYKSLGGRD